MNSQEYYQRVIDRLKNCYQFNHYVIAAGHELVAEGYDPAFPAAAEPIRAARFLRPLMRRPR